MSIRIPPSICRRCRNKVWRLTAEQVAAYCDVAYETAIHWLESGLLRGVRVHGTWSVKPRALRKLFHERPDLAKRASDRQDRLDAGESDERSSVNKRRRRRAKAKAA